MKTTNRKENGLLSVVTTVVGFIDAALLTILFLILLGV